MRSRLLLALVAGLLALPSPTSAETKQLPEDQSPRATVTASASTLAPSPAGVSTGLMPAPLPAPSGGKDAPAATAGGTPPPETETAAEKPKPLPPSLIARIDLSRQRMEVIVGGASTYSWAISSGRPGFETPRGTFRGQWSAKMWYSQKYDLAPMPHAVFFHQGAAIHATTSVGMLGQPASHGCVRLASANAATFYALVQKHGLKATQVQVFGKEPAPRIARREEPRPPTYNGQAVTYLPPGSPYAGRPSFVHNGVLYVRVR